MSGFNDFLQAIESENASEAPFLGGANTQQFNKKGKDDNTRIVVKYFVANIQDEGERLILESIMTKALDSAQDLTNVGQVVVFNEQSTFTKEGDALVMVKYAEVVNKSDA